VADIEATIDAEGFEYVEEVVDVGVESGVSVEIEIIGIDTAGANKIVENDTVVGGEKGENAIPCGLIGAASVG